MEESEKRKERLRAMRVEAAQSGLSADHLGSSPVHLFNPLAQASGAPPSAGRAAPPPRFDYYTDPMAAYSGNRSSARGRHPPDNFSSPIRSCSPTAHPASPSSGTCSSHRRWTPQYNRACFWEEGYIFLPSYAGVREF